MQKNLLLGLLLAIAAGAAAQKVNRVAFTAGLHNATVEPFWNPHPLAQSSHTTPRTAAHFGFIGDIPLGSKSVFHFQPGFQFSAKGATQNQTLDTTKTRVMRITDRQFINYIDVPLNLVVALPLGKKSNFILGGGPQASLFYGGKTSSTTYDTSGRFTFNEVSDLPVGKAEGQNRLIHFAVNALAGFDLGRIFFTANYSRGLDPYTNRSEKEFKHSTMGASVGIFLGPQPWQKKKPRKVAPPKDTDKDGVPDPTDACPSLPGAVATLGCPDSDGDGVGDALDACPGRKGAAENKGCPWPDRDGDGLNDKEDKCPREAGLAKYGGCPAPDTDGDGLNDEEDKCPQAAGTKENGGCPVTPKVPEITKEPEVKKEMEEKVATAARNIGFEHGKADLLASSLPVLDEIAVLMQQQPRLKLTVEGHTSAAGNASVNQVLSEQRAQKVKSYLQSKGVAASRIAAVGYGSSRPISKGVSEAEQAANRRVELKLTN